MKTYLHVVGGLALLFPQVPHAMSADGRALPRVLPARIAAHPFPVVCGFSPS